MRIHFARLCSRVVNTAFRTTLRRPVAVVTSQPAVTRPAASTSTATAQPRRAAQPNADTLACPPPPLGWAGQANPSKLTALFDTRAAETRSRQGMLVLHDACGAGKRLCIQVSCEVRQGGGGDGPGWKERERASAHSHCSFSGGSVLQQRGHKSNSKSGGRRGARPFGGQPQSKLNTCMCYIMRDSGNE
jgi:hypothetical protein